MTANIVALSIAAFISIILPLVILGIVIYKNPMERWGIAATFLTGAGIYIVMQWGAKEHGLSYLFNHTAFSDFMNEKYILYLLCVAVVGAAFTMIPMLVLVCLVWKRQISFGKAAMMGLGYAMAEAVMLIGYRSIMTIIELLKESDTGINTATVELFLSGYERILMIIIEVAIIVAFIYFVEQKMSIRGSIIMVVCQTLTSFLPGFLIAFSLEKYYEVYSRELALVLVYIVLTVAAFSAVVVLYSLKYELKDEKVDSRQAVIAYQKKMEKKKK